MESLRLLLRFDRRSFYYYRARYYDTQIGRFISEDPSSFEGGVNFYTYAFNNPSLFQDPEGLDAQISQAGNTVTITATILVHGRNSQAYSNYWGWIINHWWNNNGQFFHVGKCELHFDVTVTPFWDKQTKRRGPTNTVYIDSSPAYMRSHVINNHIGYWWGGAQGWEIAHEFGHIVYLPDDYYKSGPHKDQPKPPHVGHLMGEAYGHIDQDELQRVLQKGACKCR